MLMSTAGNQQQTFDSLVCRRTPATFCFARFRSRRTPSSADQRDTAQRRANAGPPSYDGISAGDFRRSRHSRWRLSESLGERRNSDCSPPFWRIRGRDLWQIRVVTRSGPDLPGHTLCGWGDNFRGFVVPGSRGDSTNGCQVATRHSSSPFILAVATRPRLTRSSRQAARLHCPLA